MTNITFTWNIVDRLGNGISLGDNIRWTDFFGPLSALTTSATEIEALGLYSASSEVEEFRASIAGDFTYGNLGTVFGTVDSYTTAVSGHTVFNITDLSADASQFWGRVSLSTSSALSFILSGDDQIKLTKSNDYFEGLTGDDFIWGYAGNDTILGGPGQDTIRGGKGHDTIWGGGGYDMLLGGSGHDIINGDNGDDTLYGSSGHDRLYGGDGNDTLHGGAQSDLLYGEKGDDWLEGGPGSDIFHFNLRLGIGLGYDTVADFEIIDSIHLRVDNIYTRFEVEQVGDDALLTCDAGSVTFLDADAIEVLDRIFII